MPLKKYLKVYFSAHHLNLYLLRSDSLLETVVSGIYDEIVLARYTVKKSVLELHSPFEGGALISTVNRDKGVIHLFQETVSKMNQINELCRSSIGYGRDPL